MPQFEPRPDSLITSEMLRQDFIPDADEVLRIIHLDESATGTDTAISLAVGAVCVASAGGCLALGGITAPILVPIIGLGAMAISAWNSRITQRDREWEAQFISDHPEIMDAVERKAGQGEPMHKIANAYETAYRAYLDGGKPQLKPAAEATQPSPDITLKPAAEATQPSPDITVGTATQLGAIPVPAIAVSDEPSAPPETYPMATKEVSRDDRVALVARLKTDCPAFIPLIKAQPIRLVGKQQTGKTTLAKLVCLLRMILLPGHIVNYTTPHGKNVKDRLPSVFRVLGYKENGAPDYPSVEREWERVTAIARNNDYAEFTAVWDEFGGYNEIVRDRADEKNRLQESICSMLRESAKIALRPIYIVHGESVTAIPGIKGIYDQFMNSTIRVEAIGEPVEDDIGLAELQPTGKFKVKDLDGNDFEGKIPGWLTEEYLLDLIGDQPPAEPPEVEWERQPTKVPKEQSFAKVKKRAITQADAEALDQVFGLVLKHYGQIIKEGFENAPAAKKRLKEARFLESNGDNRAALHCLISLPLAPNVTQFCKLFGINSGESFNRVSDVYHWAMALEESTNG